MISQSEQKQPQVLTPQQDVYAAMHARLDRIEAMHDEAERLYTEHEQHSAWLLARIEEAQKLASAMIEASHEVQ